jgi:hypothetical protein
VHLVIAAGAVLFPAREKEAEGFIRSLIIFCLPKDRQEAVKVRGVLSGARQVTGFSDENSTRVLWSAPAIFPG